MDSEGNMEGNGDIEVFITYHKNLERSVEACCVHTVHCRC